MNDANNFLLMESLKKCMSSPEIPSIFVCVHRKSLYNSLRIYCDVSRYLDRIIKGNELQEFADLLQPHQKAVTADGMYVLNWWIYYKARCNLLIDILFIEIIVNNNVFLKNN